MSLNFKYLTVPEAAAKLGITRQAVAYLIQTGSLEATWMLGRWAVPAEAVTRLKRQRARRKLTTAAA